MAINRFYSETSSEYKAQEHIRDHIFHDPNISIQTMAACAAYAAVLRYATRGRDEYPIAPRNVNELRAVLTNHTIDVIHSLISQTRAKIQAGSYQQARRLAAESIDRMLRVGDNADVLLEVHSPVTIPAPLPEIVVSQHANEDGVDNGQQQYFEHVHEQGTDCCFTPQRA